MGKIKRFIRKEILNRYKFKNLRRIKRWIVRQHKSMKHGCYVALDKCLTAKNRHRLPVIKGKKETLARIIDDKCSIARFGDGEIGLIFGRELGFQKHDRVLAERLGEVLRSNESDRMLIGLSEWIFYSDFGGYPEYRVHNLGSILNLLLPGKTYYSADISRFYKSTPDGHEALEQIGFLRRIWDNRNVTLVEGEKSRMGVGNDLFDNAKSIKRILCPAESAFSVYSDILRTTLDRVPKEDLVLVSLGPTATVLAFDLFKAGYQAIDIGHVDISYEWFLRGVKDPTERVAISGKYVNEVLGGNQVEDIDDTDYENQIIAKIEIS